MKDALGIYFREIREMDDTCGLSKEESIELVKLKDAGDKKARERLFNSGLKLVVSVAKRQRELLGLGASLTLDDLIQEGNLGLLHAIDTYDYHRDCKFSVHVFNWARAYITVAVDKYLRSVKLPSNVIHDGSRYRRTSDKLFVLSGLEPSLSDIAKNFGCDESRVAKILLVNLGKNVYTDDKVNDNDNLTYLDVLERQMMSLDDDDKKDEFSEETISLLSHLTIREQDIIKAEFFYDHDGTLRKALDSYNLHPESIRRLKAGALKKLKKISLEQKSSIS